MTEQLERKAENFTKFIPRDFTSKARQNNDKGIFPTPKDKEPAAEAVTDPKGKLEFINLPSATSSTTEVMRWAINLITGQKEEN